MVPIFRMREPRQSWNALPEVMQLIRGGVSLEPRPSESQDALLPIPRMTERTLSYRSSWFGGSPLGTVFGKILSRLLGSVVPLANYGCYSLGVHVFPSLCPPLPVSTFCLSKVPP